MSNGFLLLKDKKLQSLFKIITLHRLIRATNPLSPERKILPSTPQLRPGSQPEPGRYIITHGNTTRSEIVCSLHVKCWQLPIHTQFWCCNYNLSEALTFSKMQTSTGPSSTYKFLAKEKSVMFVMYVICYLVFFCTLPRLLPAGSSLLSKGGKLYFHIWRILISLFPPRRQPLPHPVTHCHTSSRKKQLLIMMCK